MSAPRKAYTNQSVIRLRQDYGGQACLRRGFRLRQDYCGQVGRQEIRPEQRLATASELNPAPGGVTCHREARGMGYRAATQVKGLSPEMFIVSVADGVHLAAGNSLATVKRGCKNPTGSETVARYQKECIGTWEAQCIPERVCNDKPEKGEELQMVHWESDQLIVAKKQGNACGVKGLTGKTAECGWMAGTHLPPLEVETRCQQNRRPLFLKSRVRENRKHGSVRGFIVSSVRRWL